MQCIRRLRAVARPSVAAPLASTSRPTFAAVQQLRSISLLSFRRPQLPSASRTIAVPHPPHITPTVAAADAPDVLPKVSSHPALQGIQVRNGPRDTYKPTNLVRKRRHGFLSRIRTRKGRAMIKRRKAKGRNTYSH